MNPAQVLPKRLKSWRRFDKLRGSLDMMMPSIKVNMQFCSTMFRIAQPLDMNLFFWRNFEIFFNDETLIF